MSTPAALGGKVLTAAAIRRAVIGGDIYMGTLLHVANELGVTLHVPAAEAGAARMSVPEDVDPWLDAFYGLGVVLTRDLTAHDAQSAGYEARRAALAGAGIDLVQAATVREALRLGAPVIVDDPRPYLEIDTDVQTETLP